MKGPVVILGPPGAGKSSAGRRAAALLGMAFVDLDDEIAKDAGAPSAGDVFRDEGEVSFRVRELQALARVLDGTDTLIAAGAGVVDTGPARALLARRALCVRIDVDVDVALARLSRDADTSRPWLAGAADPRAAYVAREARRPGHRAALCSWQRAGGVDAGGDRGAVAAALAAVVDALPPIFAAPLAPDVAVEPLAIPAGAFVLVDDGVAARADAGALPAPWRAPHVDAGRVLRAPGGEARKTLVDVERLAEGLIARGLTRSDLVVAVGGGAFLDAAGLACALALRGVPWWAAPTTLLAQADAGVGGKTAVNALGKKNLLGRFHPPSRTVVDARFLAGLEDAALREGRAEMLKHELLAGFPVDDVATSLAVKLSVVRRDPEERGLRAVLNLGHTLAHGLEAVVPGLRHGTAVLYGLRAMLRLSVAHAGLDAGVARTLDTRVLAVAGGALPDLPVDPAALTAALLADKKKPGRFVLLRAPGRPCVMDLGASSCQALALMREIGLVVAPTGS